MKIVRRIFLFLSFLLSFQVESSEARKKINCDGDYFRCSIPFPGLGNVKLCKLWSTQSVPSHFTLIRIKANASSTFSSPSLPSARVALPCKAQSSTKTDDSNFHGFIFPSSSFFYCELLFTPLGSMYSSELYSAEHPLPSIWGSQHLIGEFNPFLLVVKTVSQELTCISLLLV